MARSRVESITQNSRRISSFSRCGGSFFLPRLVFGGGASGGWGGVCDAWDLLSPTMFRELECRSYVYRLTKPDVLKPTYLEARKTYILKAELGPTAGLLGACVLGLETQ